MREEDFAVCLFSLWMRVVLLTGEKEARLVVVKEEKSKQFLNHVLSTIFLAHFW